MSEFALIERIKRHAVARDDVLLGIGDDAALLAVPAGMCLAVSVDTLIAGRHFPLATSAVDVGYKSLAVNLSDLAAMGAEPAWATLSLSLPSFDSTWLDQFCAGFSELAREFNVALVGGDTVRGPLSITVGIQGFVDPKRALLRSRAQVGDLLWVSGTLGDAALGLKALKAKAGDQHLSLLQRLNRPTPRVAAGLFLRDFSVAAIDVSDGLLADLTHLARRSQVGARVYLNQLPTSAFARSYVGLDDYQLRLHQLSGGDDYELLFTSHPSSRAEIEAGFVDLGLQVTVIGEITADPTVEVLDADGRRFIPALRGFDHFA